MSAVHHNQKEAGATAERDCETRRAILEAARTRFLHYSYKKTTIDEIAQDAGVGKGTVYLYFDSKEDVLLTIAKGVKRNITEQMQAIAASLATPEEKLRRMMLAMVLSVHDACMGAAHGIELVDETMQPKIAQCAQNEQDAQMALLARVLEEGVRRGDLTIPGGDAEVAARNLKMAFASFFPPYINACHPTDSRCRVSIEIRVKSMLEFVMHGLRHRAA
ncbi:MAG: TetR/AcrR family transcriptional regulator, partial [Cytophagales bacterium]|nr:TetR/AcrR family transcriptional regulator [Armatimonadota bacterium]